MEVKDGPPLEGLRGASLSPMVRAYLELNHLKQLFRQGWLRRGVPRERCESVAEHSFGVAVLALLLQRTHFEHLDRDRLLRMALVHDFGEVHAGDITPGDGVPAEEKLRREADSVERVLGDLPGADELVALWRDYAEGASPEARFLREVDRLEMALQALVYERQGLADLTEFYASAEDALRSPELEELLRELRSLREA